MAIVEGEATVHGFVAPGFEAVREAFVENFERRNELGAACAMYFRGRKVVDMWGGVRNGATGQPWEEDTMVLVFSATKGLSAMAMALAQSRGLLDYEERVCKYWPEFAEQGKEGVTVRQLLSHQAGLYALDAPVDRAVVADLDRLAVILAQQKPAWAPGERQAYHAISLGFYESELLRRVDPGHRSLGRFFADEIATPLGLDFYIRLPEEIENSRLATIEKFDLAASTLKAGSLSPVKATLDKNSPIYRSMFLNPGPLVSLDDDRVYARNLEVPSSGGVGTARAIARAYSAFATGGQELGLRADTLAQLMAPAVPPRYGFFDECLKREWCLSLGFTKPGRGYVFGSSSAFGTPGSGGSFGYADPVTGVGYAYVLNRMGPRQGGDPREVAVRRAFHGAMARLPEPVVR